MTLRPFSVVMSLIGVLLITAACGAFEMQGGGGGNTRTSKKIVYATIFITAKKSGGCVANTVPGRIQLDKNDEIEWSVVDICDATDGYSKDVDIKNWSVVTGGNCTDGTQVPVDSAANGKRHIRRGLKAGCVNRIFKYQIWVETTILADPELEIAS